MRRVGSLVGRLGVTGELADCPLDSFGDTGHFDTAVKPSRSEIKRSASSTAKIYEMYETCQYALR